MSDQLKNLIGDLKVLANMMEIARKDEDPKALQYYINAAGRILNGLTQLAQEAMK